MSLCERARRVVSASGRKEATFGPKTATRIMQQRLPCPQLSMDWLSLVFLLLAVCMLHGCSSNTAPKSGTSTTLAVTTSSLPNGQLGVAYSATLAATGGASPYTWSTTSTLPAGLTLASTGVISGTPTALATSASVSFTVTDSSTPALTQTVSLTITVTASGLTISPSSLPSGHQGTAYSATLTASGGTAPYTWSITSGALPSGLTLNTATGAITGTPTVTVTNSPITFKVQDSSSPVLTQTANLTLTIAAPGALLISTTSLPNGQVGVAYSATLAATGGMTPYTWSTTSGTLPTGLTLNTATGAITGTPTAPVTSVPLTFKVQDSSSPVQTQSANLTISVNPAVLTVTITPPPPGLAASQEITVSATTNDVAGVSWSLSPSGGTFAPATSLNAAGVTFTAPATGGVYTITATSVSDVAVSSSATIGVTAVGGVYSWHNDIYRDGANTQEFVLTTANVNTSSFGKLAACTTDGAIYTQPLWLANVTVNGAQHNVVFVATEHDSLYAFDADASPCQQLWMVSLIDSAHGGTAGETTVPAGVPGFLVGSGDGDITPEVGVTGTPVIDPSTNILYVVSKSVIASGPTYFQRLHAIAVGTGAEMTGSPVSITSAITYPGSGTGGSSVAFDVKHENQRAGLAFVNGTVYIVWASHEDAPPFYGWIMGYTYNGTSFTLADLLNVAPNDTNDAAGIWMCGAAPAADTLDNLYLITGNGYFDANSLTAPNTDFGDSFLQIPSSLAMITQFFTPSDQSTDYTMDKDYGAGGAILVDLPAGSTSTVTHLAIGGGKDGNLYVLNRDDMGSYLVGTPVQVITFGSIFSTAGYWNGNLYIAGPSSPLSAFALNTSNAQFTMTSTSPSSFSWPGVSPSISASGTTNGIAWALDTSAYCTGHFSPPCGPAVLHAYDATNLGNELWNSSLVGTDAAGNAVKFTVSTIVNGKVYVGTRGNNTGGAYGSTTVAGELEVYGLKPD